MTSSLFNSGGEDSSNSIKASNGGDEAKDAVQPDFLLSRNLHFSPMNLTWTVSRMIGKLPLDSQLLNSRRPTA